MGLGSALPWKCVRPWRRMQALLALLPHNMLRRSVFREWKKMLELSEAKLNDQYQTKVESGSKYRVRLSGIVLLNLYDNSGLVDNQDFPEVAQPPQDNPLFVSPSSFGATLRQSQIKLQAFGP